MKSIITTYPDFHALPKGIKRMLLASESFFFAEAFSQHHQDPQATMVPRSKSLSGFQSSGRFGTPSSIFGSEWKN
jgi:hypothetical protein